MAVSDPGLRSPGEDILAGRPPMLLCSSRRGSCRCRSWDWFCHCGWGHDHCCPAAVRREAAWCSCCHITVSTPQSLSPATVNCALAPLAHCQHCSAPLLSHHTTSQPVLHISIIIPLICNFSTFRTSPIIRRLFLRTQISLAKNVNCSRRSNKIIKISMKKEIIYLQKYFIYKYMSRVTLRSKIYSTQIRNCQF